MIRVAVRQVVQHAHFGSLESSPNWSSAKVIAGTEIEEVDLNNQIKN